MMLTKAQVEYIKKYLIHNPRDGTETLRLKIADMIDTDAALRARVEELENENRRLTHQLCELSNERNQLSEDFRSTEITAPE